MPEMWEKFGRWLQAERERAGLSQQQVAAHAGIHVVQLSRIENGRSGAKRETVIAIAEAVNALGKISIDIDAALGRAGFAAQSDAMEILDGVRISFDEKKFTKAQRDKLTDTIKILAAGMLAEAQDEPDPQDR